LQGFHYQIVLRELQTLSGHPNRLHEWTRAAIEMAHKYAQDPPSQMAIPAGVSPDAETV
jgi:hypothetical protein